MYLRELGVDLEQEDESVGFLGVYFVRNIKIGLIEMKNMD